MLKALRESLSTLEHADDFGTPIEPRQGAESSAVGEENAEPVRFQVMNERLKNCRLGK